MLTKQEIDMVLDLIREKHGPGYAEDKKVGALQAKLSMMKQRAHEEVERCMGCQLPVAECFCMVTPPEEQKHAHDAWADINRENVETKTETVKDLVEEVEEGEKDA